MHLQRPPFLRPQFVPFASATAMKTTIWNWTFYER